MRTPQLTCPITIESQSTTQDSFGQPQQTWHPVVSCFAEIDIQGSALVYSTAEFMGKATYRITIPWTNQYVFQPNMHIVYVDPATNITHTYNVEVVLNPRQRNCWITFLCYELDGAQ